MKKKTTNKPDLCMQGIYALQRQWHLRKCKYSKGSKLKWTKNENIKKAEKYACTLQQKTPLRL